MASPLEVPIVSCISWSAVIPETPGFSVSGRHVHCLHNVVGKPKYMFQVSPHRVLGPEFLRTFPHFFRFFWWVSKVEGWCRAVTRPLKFRAGPGAKADPE